MQLPANAPDGMNFQRLIPTNLDAELGFDDFHAGENRELVRTLRRIVRGERKPAMLYFWGGGGVGKTHLLHACCRLALTMQRPHAYLSVGAAPPDIAALRRIAPPSVVCADDFQYAGGDADDAVGAAWQRALFELYERVAGGGGAMVAAADRPPAALGLALKDLQSRLPSGGVIKVAALNEADTALALQSRAKRKGFVLSDAVLQFILTYYQRDTASLFALLERIDNASLAAHRKVTVPFIKGFLTPP